MKRVFWALALAAGAVLPSALQAQAGIAVRAGVFGLGGEANVDLGRHLAIRGGIGKFPGDPSATIDNTKYIFKLPSSLSNVGVDLYPAGGAFRLSAGFLFKHDVALEAHPDNTTYEFDGQTYSRAEVGTVRGDFAYKSTAPYASFGVASRGRGLGVTLDFGAAFMGEPKVSLTATGGTRSGDPTFQQHLQASRADVQDNASKYAKILPIISLGLRYGI